MFKVAIAGVNGKMGSEIESLIGFSDQLKCVAKIVQSKSEIKDKAYYTSLEEAVRSNGGIDVLIDFTSAEASMNFAQSCESLSVAHVCGSTGFAAEQIKRLEAISTRSLLFLSPNMSFGISVLKMLCKKAASILGDEFDIEILEAHHNKKIDAPSGTALMLGEAIANEKNLDKSSFNLDRNASGIRKKDEIGFATIRGGSIVGEHTAFFISESEKISINHTSFTKRIYAQGAIKAAIWLMGQKAGRIYNMDDMM